MSRRIEQVNALLQQEIGAIIARDIEFPLGVIVTILSVSTSGDLHHAAIATSIFPEGKRGETLVILKKHTRHIELQLRGKISMHHIPALSWTIDATAEHGANVEAILDSLQQKG